MSLTTRVPMSRRRFLGAALVMLSAGGLALLLAPAPVLGAGGGAAPEGAGVRQAVPAPAQVPPQPGPLPPAPTPAAPAPQLTRGVWAWQRTEYSNDTTLAAPDPSKYTIAFGADGRLTLQADCNRATGTYTVDGPRITVMPGATTLIACPPGSEATAFLRDLREVATYVFDGQNLVLNLKLDGGNMIFSPQPAASLTGGEWRVTGVNNGRGGVVSVLPDAALTMQFGDDGAVSGNSGCNLFRGPYTVAGAALSFGPLVSTRRACLSEALNAQEQQLLAALAAVTTYQLSGDRLTLRDASGAQQVGLMRP